MTLSRNSVLPIVMGARKEEYEAVAPYNSFIHVDQFKSPKELATYLLELDQSKVISFNDLEYEVASKVIQEMFEKAFSNTTMDYELIFWGYTFAVKKITCFAQVKIED